MPYKALARTRSVERGLECVSRKCRITKLCEGFDLDTSTAMGYTKQSGMRDVPAIVDQQYLASPDRHAVFASQLFERSDGCSGEIAPDAFRDPDIGSN